MENQGRMDQVKMKRWWIKQQQQFSCAQAHHHMPKHSGREIGYILNMLCLTDLWFHNMKNYFQTFIESKFFNKISVYLPFVFNWPLSIHQDICLLAINTQQFFWAIGGKSL